MLSRFFNLFHSKRRIGCTESIMEHMLSITKERPLNINLETSTACNSRCCFCGYPKISRKKEIMDMGLFQSILDQYKSIGGGCIGFSPLMSDPLTDPYIVDRTKIILTKYSAFWSHMFTNAIGFSKFSEGEIELFASLTYINISMGGPDRDSYLKLYRVDRFDTVVENIRTLQKIKEKIGSKVRISIHFRVIDPDLTKQSDLVKEFTEYGFDCRDFQNKFSDFGGAVKQDDVPKGASILIADNTQQISNCVIPHTEYTICPNGDVVGCGCFDSNSSTIVGNIKEASIIDIWKNSAYLKFRYSFSNKSIPLICKTCSSYIPLDKIFNNTGLRDYEPYGDPFWLFLRL